MQSTDERITVILQKTKDIRTKRDKLKKRITVYASVVCSLVLIISAGIAMPSVVESAGRNISIKAYGAGSLFAGSVAFGFIIIGLISFLLGVGVTILCLKIQQDSVKEGGGK